MLKLERNYAKDGKGIASLHGDFILPHLKEIFPILKMFFEEFEFSVLDLSKVSAFDSGAFQMLSVFKKDASVQNKKFKIVNHSECVLNLIDLYGATGLFRDKVVVTQEARKQGFFRYGTDPQEFV